jgi:hypothetical protein
VWGNRGTRPASSSTSTWQGGRIQAAETREQHDDAGETAAMKKRCEFQGGAGLPEKYRPKSPCLGEFEPTVKTQKFCKVCQFFAYAAKDYADYHANRKKLLERDRENRQRRAKAAGRPYRILGNTYPCEYRDQRGKHGEGCLRKFKLNSGRQVHCRVCKRLAALYINRKWRHSAEGRARRPGA